MAAGAGRLAAGLVLAGLLVAGWTPAAGAARRADLQLSVAPRWGLAPPAGAWAPYVVMVRNAGADAFDGGVALVPNVGTSPYGTDASTVPVYRSRVTVPAGSSHRSTFVVAEPPTGYHAELRDAQGRVVARASPSATHGSGTVAVLSDVTGADQRIGAPLLAMSRTSVGVSRFESAQDLPASAGLLAGLNGLVIDRFDTGSLDQARLQAIRDFVALGGTLIEAGGASWRRTLLPLPADLLPMRPTGTAPATVAALAELSGLRSAAPVEVAVGDLAGGAGAPVTTEDGTPLVVQAAYGSGRIVELAFDPLAAPFDTQVDLAAVAWSQAVDRGLSGGQGGAGWTKFMGGSPPGSAGLTGSGPGSWGTPPNGFFPFPVYRAAAAPALPFGTLVFALAAYVLLVSVVSAAALRALGRSGLMWVAVPALAVACTATAYLVGFGARGGDYRLDQLQVQRLGPGVVETHSFDSVTAPRRGDVTVTVGPGMLVSTADARRAPAGAPEITVAGRSDVVFPGVPVWDTRTVQTLSVSHAPGPAAGPGPPVDAQLRLAQGRLHGQVVNRTGRALRDVQLVASNAVTPLVAALPPGGSATVDVAMARPGTAVAGKGGPVGPGVVVGPAAAVYPGMDSGDLRQVQVGLAASHAVGATGELALVGSTDALDTPAVDGGRPAATAHAMVAEPVHLLSADSLAYVRPASQLVSSLSPPDGSGQVDVYEVQLPAGLTGHVGLSAMGMPQAGPAAAEVFDWRQRTWRPLGTSLPQRAAASTQLQPGEVDGGVVRMRVRGDDQGTVLSLVDLP